MTKKSKSISKQEAVAVVKKMIAQKNAIHNAIKKGEPIEKLKKQGIKFATPL